MTSLVMSICEALFEYSVRSYLSCSDTNSISCWPLFSGISTLMCYLELHSRQWLENLSNVYASCKVQCYGGPNQLQSIAKKVCIMDMSLVMRKYIFGGCD